MRTARLQRRKIHGEAVHLLPEEDIMFKKATVRWGVLAIEASFVAGLVYFLIAGA